MLLAAVERVFAEIPQRVGVIERLPQDQVRQPTVVLDELLLARLLRWNRRGSVDAVVISRTFACLDDDGVVSFETGPGESLLEIKLVVLKIQHERPSNVPAWNGGVGVGICNRGQVSPCNLSSSVSIPRNASAPPIAVTAASMTSRAFIWERPAKVFVGSAPVARPEHNIRIRKYLRTAVSSRD